MFRLRERRQRRHLRDGARKHDLPEALKYVAKKYGIEVAERELTPEEERRNDDRESMMVVSSYAAEYFAKTLHETPEGQNIGIAYFRERGFSDATILAFGLGYCPAAVTPSHGRRSKRATKRSSSPPPD